MELSALNLLRQAAAMYGSRPAVIDGTGEISFGDVPRTAIAYAHLVAQNTPPGSRIMLLMRNCIDYVLLQLGLEAVGRIRVPLNWRSSPLEVANIIASCSPHVLVYDQGTLVTAERALELVGSRRGPLPLLFDVTTLRDRTGSVNSGVIDRNACDECYFPTDSSRPDSPISINYTSGTLGTPKGAVHTVGSWQTVYRNLLSVRDFRSSDRLGLVGPLSHAAGAYVVPALLMGVTVVLAAGATPAAIAHAITRERLTMLQCVPTILTRLTSDASFSNSYRRQLRLIIYGGERMPANTLSAALDLFGPVLCQNYGLTEAMMTCATLQPHEHFRATAQGREVRHGTLGRPYPFVEFVIRRPDATPVVAGEIGEITIRSTHLMAQYWQQPQATAQILRDGWLWSGDLAAWDDEGFVVLRGRAKDLVISGGMNIYPGEVEAYICSLEGVAEAAVFGKNDDQWGERLVAAIALRDPSDLRLAALKEQLKRDLGIRCPKQWLVLDQLPRTGNGKIDLRSLKEQAS